MLCYICPMKTKTTLLLIVSVWLAAFASGVAAQGDGYPVTRRCIVDALELDETPPFPGTLLMQGWAGVHGFRANWDTTRVVSFIDAGAALPGGALSPDGRWYAVPWGSEIRANNGDILYYADELRAFSTIDSEEVWRVNWNSTFNSKSPISQIYWRDDERAYYTTMDDGTPTGTFLVNFFAVNSEPVSTTLDPLDVESVSYFSPDWTRALVNDNSERFDPSAWQLVDVEADAPLLDLNLAEFSQVAWTPSSAFFAAEVLRPNDDGELLYQIALFDRDGARVQTLLDMPEGARVLFSPDNDLKNMVWSPDGRYLAVITSISTAPPIDNLYIIDTMEGRAIDTCLAPSGGLAWSPGGNQLALMASGEEHRPIYILEVAQERLLFITRHDGNLIGWREE